MKRIVIIIFIVCALLSIWIHHALYRRDMVYAFEVVFIGGLAAANYIQLSARNSGIR